MNIPNHLQSISVPNCHYKPLRCLCYENSPIIITKDS